MNIEDSIRNSNSWHWLFCAVVATAVVSYFVPSYGWRDVLAYKGRTLAANEKRAKDNLTELKELSQIDTAQLKEQTRKLKDEAKKVHEDFARYGMEEIPVGDKVVFSAQSRVAEALNRRKLRIISTEAKVAVRQPARTAVAQSSKATSQQESMTPEEIMARAEETAAQIDDKKMAKMIIDDARKMAAKVKAEKAQSAIQKTPPKPQVKNEAGASSPFKTEALEYKVTGDFRDMFMFFVAETHKKPYYNFKDIVVENGENGMELSFVLQVNHK